MGSGLLSLLEENPLLFVLLGGSLLLAIALHEFGHAYMADLQGDRLPRAMGRVTLNPLRHLDPIGTLFIFLVGFGWGKPVEFRPQALTSRRFGAALVALAGPIMNLLLALVGALVFGLVAGPGGQAFVARVGFPPPGGSILADVAFLFARINVLLAVFNLIPLPPLDGSRLLTIFLPPRRQNIIFFLDRWGFLILIGLLFFGGFTFLEPVLEAVSRVIFSISAF